MSATGAPSVGLVSTGAAIARTASPSTCVIRQARDLGFSIPQIGELVGLWQNRRRPSRQVKALAQAHIQELQQKAQDLLAMKATLEHLVQCRHGDDRPECPILENLAEENIDVSTPAKPVVRRKSSGLRRV